MIPILEWLTEIRRKGKIRDLELFPIPWINVRGPTLVIFSRPTQVG